MHPWRLVRSLHRWITFREGTTNRRFKAYGLNLTSAVACSKPDATLQPGVVEDVSRRLTSSFAWAVTHSATWTWTSTLSYHTGDSKQLSTSRPALSNLSWSSCCSCFLSPTMQFKKARQSPSPPVLERKNRCALRETIQSSDPTSWEH